MTSLKHIIFNKKYIFPFFIFIISLCVVFYQFLNIPKNTTFDEIEFAKLALQLDNQPYTPYSPYATGHATLYFYIILFSFKLFGVSLFSLRLPSALFGVITPLIFYFILKRIKFNLLSSNLNMLFPFILSLIFVTLRWYFNFARFGFEITFLLFLELSSLLCVLSYIKNKKVISLVLSGLFTGFAYNSYQPGRIFVLIPFFLLISYLYTSNVNPAKAGIYQGMFSRFRIGSGMTILLYFLIPFFVLILPLTVYLNIHKDTRFYQQFYPDNHEMTLQEKGGYFVRNFISTIGIFNIKGDVNGRHNYPNKPALNPILGLMFLIGLLIAITNIKKINNQLFLLWFLLSLAPTLVTYPWENPNMLRTFTAIPSVIYFIGLSVQNISNSKRVQKYRYRKLLYFGIIILIFISSAYELRTYFVHQSRVFKEAFEAERPLNSYLHVTNEK